MNGAQEGSSDQARYKKTKAIMAKAPRKYLEIMRFKNSFPLSFFTDEIVEYHKIDYICSRLEKKGVSIPLVQVS